MDEPQVKTIFGPMYGTSMYRKMAFLGMGTFIVSVVGANVANGLVRGLLIIVGLLSALTALAGVRGSRKPYRLTFDVQGFEVRARNQSESVRVPWRDVGGWDIQAWGGQVSGDMLLAWPADHVQAPGGGDTRSLWNAKANAWLVCDIGQCDGTEEEIAAAISSVAPHIPRRTLS